jgi:hypothetical protein
VEPERVFISFRGSVQSDRDLSESQQMKQNNAENEHAFLWQRALPQSSTAGKLLSLQSLTRRGVAES